MSAKATAKAAPAPRKRRTAAAVANDVALGLVKANVTPLLADLTPAQKAEGKGYVASLHALSDAFQKYGSATVASAVALLRFRGTFTTSANEPDYEGGTDAYKAAYGSIMAALIPDEKSRARVQARIRKQMPAAAKQLNVTLKSKGGDGNPGNTGKTTAPSAASIVKAIDDLNRAMVTGKVKSSPEVTPPPAVKYLDAGRDALTIAEGTLAKGSAPAKVKKAALNAAIVAMSVLTLTGQEGEFASVNAQGKARAQVKRSENEK